MKVLNESSSESTEKCLGSGNEIEWWSESDMELALDRRRKIDRNPWEETEGEEREKCRAWI
jgi:hypothetical protein